MSHAAFFCRLAIPHSHIVNTLLSLFRSLAPTFNAPSSDISVKVPKSPVTLEFGPHLPSPEKPLSPSLELPPLGPSAPKLPHGRLLRASIPSIEIPWLLFSSAPLNSSRVSVCGTCQPGAERGLMRRMKQQSLRSMCGLWEQMEHSAKPRGGSSNGSGEGGSGGRLEQVAPELAPTAAGRAP